MVPSIKNQMKPKTFYEKPLNKSKGILDDYAVRKDIKTKEGRIDHTPTNAKDIVNKEYVDDSIPASISLFFTENGSDLGGVYLDIEVDPVTAGEENTLTAIPANSTGNLMASFATPLNDSVIDGIVELPIGVYSFHVHCEASSAAKLSMYAELYHRNVGGTETLLLTSEDSNLIPITKGSIGFHGSLLIEKDWIAGDRIVIKLYGTNNSAAVRNLTIYVEGTTASRTELPAIKGSSVGIGDVTAGANLTDNNVIIGDGGAKGISSSAITEAEIETLTDNSMADALHRHSELSASDGTPDQALTVDANGRVNITNDFSVDSDLLFVDIAGNVGVGIGTGTPSEMLDVVGNAEINGDIIVTGTVDGIDIATDVAANTTHRGDNTQAHSDYLKNDAVDIGVGLTLTGDNASADTQYTAQVLYNTDDTPPAASGFPIGTIYIQYTA